jgi:hypothetical protein
LRRILLVLAAAALMVVLVAPSVTAKPSGFYCAVTDPGTGDQLASCSTTGKKDCEERAAATGLNFGKCTKGLPDPS